MNGRWNQTKYRENDRSVKGQRALVATAVLLSSVLLAAAALSTPASAGPGSTSGAWDNTGGVCKKGNASFSIPGENPDHNGDGIICVLVKW